MLKRFSDLTSAVLLISSALVLGACADPQPIQPVGTPLTDCDAGIAQIRVGDGWQQVLCGCVLEAAGTVTYAPVQLTCTVNAGTRVFFRFEGSVTPHQIAPNGGPDFPGGERMGPAWPDDWVTQSAFTIVFPTAGTNYPYVDLFSQDGGIRGTVNVQ